MSKIKFLGFSDGSPVSLTAKIGSQSEAGAIASWGAGSIPPPPSGKSVTIQVVRAQGPAPMAVFLQAEVSGFDVSGQQAERQLDFEWDMGNTDAVSEGLTSRSDGLWGRDTNIAYLPRISHTYATPGPRTVRIRVRDGIDEVSAETVIEVENPDIVFADTRTIYVDNTGTLDVQHAGAPAGAQYAQTTAQAYAKWLGFDSAGGRILFARGQTHDPFPDQFTAAKHVSLGAWGAGNKPIISCQSGDGARPTETVLSFRCADLHFVGGWDAALETGSRREGVAGNVHSDVVIHNCVFTNMRTAIQLNAAATDTGWYAQISHNRIQGWQDYGILLPRPRFFGLVGNEITQDPGAAGGGRGKGVTSNWHGPVRTSAPRPSGWTVIRHNEIFSASSWTTASNRPSHQPCIRWNSTGVKDATAFFERNILEGGRQVMSMDPGSSNSFGQRNHLIFQMNYLLQTANSGDSALNMKFTGLVLRNNVFITPDVRSENDDVLPPPLTIVRSNYSDTDHGEALVEIYHNTHVDLRTDATATKTGKSSPANFRWFAGGDQNLPANVLMLNNAQAGPNRSDTGDTVVDTGTTLFAPYYQGLFWFGTNPRNTSFATPTNSAVSAAPATPSSDTQGASVLRDLLGRMRPSDAATRTIGALQYQP